MKDYANGKYSQANPDSWVQMPRNAPIAEMIRSAKENDENAMLELVERFRPVINKYFKRSNYDEDVKSELELKLIEVVKIDINFDNLRDKNESALVNYIVSSLYHRYLAVSMNRAAKEKSELVYENDVLSSLPAPDNSFFETTEENILLETLQSILTEREYCCVYAIVFMGYAAEEVAKYLHITKQACNQCKLRAFEKLRKYYARENG
jgi:DNA-directed RNA polymerase specialized sigma subunit